VTLALRKFVTYGNDGQMAVLHCKICGVVIGEKQERTVGFRHGPDGRVIERVLEGFARNHLYMEIKITFEDGSAHVTNGCKNCLTGLTDGARLSELEQCDMEEQGLKARTVSAVEVIETKIGGGIL
jgi:hypothetical protein